MNPDILMEEGVPPGYRMELRKSLHNNVITYKKSKSHILIMYCISIINAIIFFLSVLNLNKVFDFFN